MQRVVITGMGCVSALGLSAGATWRAMREGQPGIGPDHRPVAADIRTPIAAQLKGYEPTAHFDEKRLVMLDPVSQYALVAAREALAQSGLTFDDAELADRTAVVIGTGIGGATTQDQTARRLYGEGNPRVHPMAIVRVMPNAPASQISLEFGLRGPAFAVASACASANHALARRCCCCAAALPRWLLPAAPRPASRWAASRPGRPCACWPTTPAAPSAATAAAWCWAKAPASSCWRRWNTPRRAAPRSWPNWSAPACRPMPPTS